MGIGGSELLIIILAIVVLLFGAKKIPELARGLGSGVKEFKKGLKDEPDGGESSEKKNISHKQSSDHA